METIAAFLVVFIVKPIEYIFKHKGLLILLVLAVAGLVAYNRFAPKPTPAEVQAIAYRENIPSIREAPTIVQTTSRLYYVSQYTDDGKIITLTKYYSYDTKWQLQKIPLPIDRTIYGEVRIIPRVK